MQVETGSAITWKYPSVVLKGDNSVGEFYSVALTNNFQQVGSRAPVQTSVYVHSKRGQSLLQVGVRRWCEQKWRQLRCAKGILCIDI